MCSAQLYLLYLSFLVERKKHDLSNCRIKVGHNVFPSLSITVLYAYGHGPEP